MSSLLLVLIQAQERPRLSKTVVVAAILVFLAGVSLLVYFFRRYKKTEKEAQDEWDRPEQSLFAAPASPVIREQTQSAEVEAATASADSTAPEPADEAEHVAIPALALEPQPLVETQPSTRELNSDVVPPIIPPAPIEAVSQPATQVLSSESRQPESDAAIESIPFYDDDLWAELDAAEQESPASTQLLGVEAAPLPETQTPIEIAEPAKPQSNTSQTELLGAARVDARPPREPFEPPTITRIVHREPWEPPHIEPLKPRVEPLPAPAEPIAANTQLLASPPVLLEAPPASAEVLEPTKSFADIEAPVVAPAGARAMRIPAGSILGLPAEPSHAPLVLGEPSRPRDEVGIGALSNYGKSAEGAGHAGTIALAVVILLVGGAIASYLFVPSVKSRVNEVVARIRGIDPNPPPPIDQAKARIFLARGEAVKNTVKARGAVINISEEMLSDLSVEVSIERWNGAPAETRKIAVKPAQLSPRQQGLFEFEYDGNRATGFSGYRPVRLVSGEAEIKFSTPARTG